MRFDNDGMSLWFGTPDAPSPADTVPAGAEVPVTVAVHPGGRSNKVEVLFRVNKGHDETVNATWLRNDVQANVQYFTACLPSGLAGGLVEYIPVCRRAGRMVPSEDDIRRARSSFHVAEAPVETRGKAPASDIGPVVAARAERAASGSPATMLTENSSATGEPVSGKIPFDISRVLGGRANAGMATAAAGIQGESAAVENPAANSSQQIRINTLNAFLSTNEDKEAVKTAFLATKGEWTAALASLKDKLPEESFKKVELAHSLAVWSDDNVPVVKAVLAAQPDLTSLRDVALRFNVDKLTALVDPKAVPETTPGATTEEKQRNFAVGLRRKLFLAEPTAVLHRMVAGCRDPDCQRRCTLGRDQIFE